MRGQQNIKCVNVGDVFSHLFLFRCSVTFSVFFLTYLCVPQTSPKAFRNTQERAVNLQSEIGTSAPVACSLLHINFRPISFHPPYLQPIFFFLDPQSEHVPCVGSKRPNLHSAENNGVSPWV